MKNRPDSEIKRANADFGTGSVLGHIVRLSLPLMLAQFVQLAYNLVDRIYIGHLPGESSLALTGLGLTFPVITLTAAFTSLFSTGGIPLFSIARGACQNEKARYDLGNTFSLLCLSSVVLMIICYVFLKPILFAMGASAGTWPYARDYLLIYLAGTPFSMLAAGMNGFLAAQGFPKTGMFTTMIGAGINMVLDPILIYGFGMNIAGAAIATIISQIISCIWVLAFLFSSKPELRLERKYMKLSWPRVRSITALGTTGFTVQASNFAVQAVSNSQLLLYGQDLYVGIMTVLSSVREIAVLPVTGITSGAQPIIGFNYGAGKYERIWSCIRYVSISTIAYTLIIWLLIFLFPGPILGLFTPDQALIQAGIPALQVYFFGYVFQALQFAGQTVFQGLGKAGYSIFFSVFRKIIIVVPLTLLLPYWMGVYGVLAAEPISNVVGGTFCYVTMLVTMKKMLKTAPVPAAAEK